MTQQRDPEYQGPPQYQPGQAPATYPPTYQQSYPVPQHQGPSQRNVLLSRNSLFIGIVAFLVLGILGSGYYVATKTVLKDSGIAACEAMAKRVNESKPDKGDNDKMTQNQYDQLREAFADSRHSDIRDPGVRLVDTIWTLQETPEKDQMGVAFLTMGSMMSDLRSLQTGCKNHGIQVDLMSNTK